jgi:hypothetical protein
MQILQFLRLYLINPLICKIKWHLQAFYVTNSTCLMEERLVHGAQGFLLGNL